MSGPLRALPTTPAPSTTAGGAGPVVFAGRLPDPQARSAAALLDGAFLTEIGWDAQQHVLRPAAAHPLLGRPVCRVGDCEATAVTSDKICPGCRKRMEKAGLDIAGLTVLPPRPRPRPRLTAARPGEGCRVVACLRERRRGIAEYCEVHQARLRAARRADPTLEEPRWRVAEPPVSLAGEVNLRGLADRVVCEVLLGLQQRCRLDGVKTKDSDLRVFAGHLRRQQVRCLEDYTPAGPTVGTLPALAASVRTHARRAQSHAEDEVAKDVWDLALFGHSGTLDFTVIRQDWLRQAAKRWAADDLPRRRVRPGRRTSSALAVRHHIGCLARLSDVLGLRDDDGEVPAALSRTDMETFLHRLAYLENRGQLSRDARTRSCREVRAVLVRIRAMGLTRPGQIAAHLGEDFALHIDDIPAQPERAAADRDLPAEIMRQLCEYLERIGPAHMRTAVELAIDTGRRPEEICSLRYECLTRDSEGHPVLLFDNHKAERLGRRLPISETTATVITAQQQRVRTRYPRTPPGDLVLLPTDRRNPAGTRAITAFSASFYHRTWIKNLPPLLTRDGAEFDKRHIVLYAYRHTYAQRHADAGVPVDVLCELMDHRKITTTQGYYRVGEGRRRTAVDKVTTLQFDRHGNRVWRQAAELMDSEHIRRTVGSVAVPFGTCAEPSNVKAGGQSCPFRFRCTGCDHFRTDVSYLPDLTAYLDDLLRNRERIRAAVELDDWARTEALPSEEEISRVRHLINRIRSGMDDLEAGEREQIHDAVTLVRRHRTVMLGMPRMRVTPLDIRTEKTS
jgi:integrase